MLHLDTSLKLDAAALASPNLVERFSDLDLQRIGEEVWEGYDADEKSRTVWKKRNEASMDLAMQIQKDKSFPWPNCANVDFPLVTIAVLQFHARAYPAIISGTDIVHCRVIGEDLDGKKTARARRVAIHMSYQVLEEDVSWEEMHDRLLIQVAVVGSAFIKTYHDPDRGHDVSELVASKDLVLNYWAKSVEDCMRKTHVLKMARNEVHTRVLRGTFRDILDAPWYTSGSAPFTTADREKTDTRTGLTPPPQDGTTPLTILEQHCSLDLDRDGYAEPYIVTIDADSKTVLRIVTRFDREEDITRVKFGPRAGQIISVSPMEYFTKYPFIPSPDGGIYDIGFGMLVGPLNESVNSIVNQLLDAGTMSNSGGGFLGRGAKIRGGNYSFSPFEWKRIDSSGDDIRKSLVKLEVSEPSGVLLNLLTFLINYTNRISGATDAIVGENPGQNTPAETSRSMIEQGGKIYSAIFKRIWRSMREEFKKRYLLNALFLSEKKHFGEGKDFILREDYLGDPSAIVPVADPRIASKEERILQASALKAASMTTQGYDLEEVEKRFLRAHEIDGVSVVFPGPGKVPPLPNPKMMIEQAKTEREKLKLAADKFKFLMSLDAESRLIEAKLVELRAKAALELAQAGGVKSASEVAAFEAGIGAMKVNLESLDRQRKMTLDSLKGMEDESGKPEQSPDGRGLSGMAHPAGNAGGLGGAGGMAGVTA